MGLFLIAELLTGSFYLLMLAIAALITAISVHLGVTSADAQLLIATLVSLISFAICYLIRRNFKNHDSNTNLNLDVGVQIMVEKWQPDGTACVKYRGAKWTAINADLNTDLGLYKIKELSGNRLVLTKN